MRRLWPKSLYGQILAVAALAMFLAQSVNTAMLIFGAKARATVESASMLVGRVSNQIERQRLVDDDRPQRGDRRRRSPSIALEIGNRPVNPPGFKSQPELVEHASEYLLAVDPQISSIRLSKGPLANLPSEMRDGPMRRWRQSPDGRDGRERPREALLLSMKMTDGRWVNAAAPIRNFGVEPAFVVLMQTLVLYLAVLIPLALVARRIVRPLKALTERVGDVGLGNDSPPMEPRGPSDVRELIEAFNGAESRLSSLLMEKDVMLGAIGHDLKTPLASLRVRIENVDDDAERDKMAATVDEMVRILDDILMLARLGKSAEDIQLTDLAALAETVVSEFPDDAKIEPGEVAERIVAPVRPVLIRRALRNLVSNALQYGGNAMIRVEQRAAEVSLVVEDNGPGIPQEQMQAMFEPFARAEGSRNRGSGGSGLGLTIARAIAQAHRGGLTLENRAEGGLRATLQLPQPRTERL
jgi:signal transduction histidine kinase